MYVATGMEKTTNTGFGYAGENTESVLMKTTELPSMVMKDLDESR